MLIIYSEKASPRLDYVLEEIFGQRLGIAWEITHAAADYMASAAPHKINYSAEVALPGLQIIPQGLLFENDIRQMQPAYSVYKEALFLFPSASGFAADIFSMTFWWLSRYEEYLPYQADTHQRFVPGSILPASHYPQTPILDQALLVLYAEMGLEVADKYAIYPTLDIDIAFKHKGRSPYLWIGGWIRMMLRGNFADAVERVSVWFGKKDPNDTFGYFMEKLNPLQKNTRIFLQVSKRGKYDKPVSLEHREYADIVRKMAERFEIGLHPGYTAGTTAEGISSEKKRLEHFLEKPIHRSRQHFLRMHLPETYTHLISAGITHDYTMGFAGSSGFRAGTGQSFRFFDLTRNEATALAIHPFCTMDVSMKNYRQLPVEKAIEEVQNLKTICKKSKTPFCFIFHNESLSDSGEWKNWTRVFEACIQ